MNPAQQQARLAGAADQPARPDMAREGHRLERALPILLAREIAASAQPPAIGHRVLVLPADPGRDADAGFGRVVVVQGKRKPPERGIEEDRSFATELVPRLVSGRNAAPRRRLQRLRARMILRKRLTLSATAAGELAGQHMLEMPPGELVLALEEEGAGELQPNAHQLGPADQHGAEDIDRLVQQFVALVLGHARPLGSLDRLHPRPEQSGHVLPSRGRAKGEADKDRGCGQGEGSRHGVLHSARKQGKKKPPGRTGAPGASR